jgi:hypothetical protein
MGRFDDFGVITLEELEKLALFRLADAVLLQHARSLLPTQLL